MTIYEFKTLRGNCKSDYTTQLALYSWLLREEKTMRHHGCVFAKYCNRYEHDNCQGCAQCVNSVVDMADEVRRLMERSITKRSTRYSKYEGDNKMKIKRVIFNEPATIVYWEDGTKTVVKCQGDDTYSKETGLAVAIAKKALGNKSNFNEVFKKWIPEYGKDEKK